MFIKKTQRKKKIMVFTQNLQNQMMNRKTVRFWYNCHG